MGQQLLLDATVGGIVLPQNVSKDNHLTTIAASVMEELSHWLFMLCMMFVLCRTVGCGLS